MSNIKNHSCLCGELLIKSTTDGLKIRGKLIIVEDGITKSVCKSCNAEVVLPISIQPSAVVLEKSLPKKVVVSRKKIIDIA
jgi:hypothetical protein